MIHGGHIYGAILNDRDELVRLAAAFGEKPYLAAPKAPVLYMKPAMTIAAGTVGLTAGARVNASATLALLISRAATRIDEAEAFEHIGATAIAIDLSYPAADYYRPAIAQRSADGFLVLGEWRAPSIPDRITTLIDDQPVHEWTLDRLERSVARLVADISAFLTLAPGDVLLVGLPGDAPIVGAGSRLRAKARGHSAASAQLEEIVQ